MRESVAGLLDKADLAIATASGVVEESKLGPIAAACTSLRLRLDYPEDVLIAALAGGTGSGKSSLLNAMAGDDKAEIGGIRPTTEEPLALVPEDRLQALSGYLRDLGVASITSADLGDRLCVIDLPDTDSVELDHRLQVDALLGRIDVVVWVVDPEKYRDAALHHRYLAPLAGYGSQFVFVMNQIDRVDVAARPSVLSDFSDALVSDGFGSPTVIATSANPPAGPPQGVDQLLDALERLRGSALIAKMLIGLEQSISDLLASTGESSLDFERRAASIVASASLLAAGGRSDEATDALTGFLEGLADEAGGRVADRISEVAAAVPSHVQAAVEAATEPEKKRWLPWSGKQRELSEEERAREVAASLDARITAPVRDLVRQRAAAIAAITDLSLSVAAARAGLTV